MRVDVEVGVAERETVTGEAARIDVDTGTNEGTDTGTDTGPLIAARRAVLASLSVPVPVPAPAPVVVAVVVVVVAMPLNDNDCGVMDSTEILSGILDKGS